MTTKEPQPPPQQTRHYVKLRRKHPHAGRVGFIPMNDCVPETINMFGNVMVKIQFEDGSGCYASPVDLEDLEPTSPPAPKKKD